VPRRFRSVAAWRSSKPRKRPTASVPGTSKAKAELCHRLGRATPEVNGTPERMRKRYIDAIDSVADYLEDIGADAVWAKRFDELSGALEDLVKGALQPPLTPQYRNLEGEK
jgi:hypothetical protein